MAGYSWLNGKSNNAVAAENDGKMVATKFAAWARQWKRFKGCIASDVAAAIDPSEWHHSSKFYNRVYYYDPTDMLLADNRDKLARAIRTRKLFDRIMKQHGQGGRFSVLMADGKLWHHVEKDHRYSLCHLARMVQTITNGHVPACDWSESERLNEKTLRSVGVIA